MKTTLLNRSLDSDKAIKILGLHPVYSSYFPEFDSCQNHIKKIGLGNLEKNLFLTALTHRSFCNENENWPFPNNERLEFIGDSVLELFISEQLFHRFPEMAEGPLSKFRSALVNESFLAKWGRIIGFESLVLLGKGELKNKENVQNSILADTFEALIGAVHLSQGFSVAAEVLSAWISSWEENEKQTFFATDRLTEFDPKSRLQELSLAKVGELPTYVSQEVEDGLFEVSLLVRDQVLGKLNCDSKKKAEKTLAYHALKNNMIDEILEKGKEV
jgi:ribonuclease-3